MFGKKDRILSIKIGEKYIKFILVEKKNNQRIIKNNLNVEMDPEILENTEKTYAKIKEIIKENSWEKVTKNLLYNSPSIVIRDLEVPIIPKNELRPVIEREVEDIYGDISDKKLVYEIIGKVQKGNSKVYQLFFALIDKSDIDEIEKQKFNLKSIDLEIFADNRIFSNSISEEKNTLILDMTREKTTVFIYRGKHLKIYRELNIGGQVIDKKISNSLNISEEEAEEIKIEYGFVDQKRARELMNEGQKIGIPLNMVYQDITEQWNRKIETSIEYFKNNNQGEGVDEFYITGKVSDLKGIKQFLKDKWEIEIKDFLADNLFKDETSDENKIDFKRNIAPLGATLLDEPIIDLKEEKNEDDAKYKLKYIIIAIIVMIILFIGYKKYKIIKIQSEIENYRGKIKKLEKPLDDYRKLEETESFLKNEIEKLESMSNKNGDFVDFLYSLDGLINNNIHFQSINYSKNKVLLKGTSISNGGFPEVAINNFLSQLDKKYQNVNLTNMTKQEETVVSFEINLILDGGESKNGKN
ncbi:MAG: cell division FtsA domain-containing protein [Fusobacteriota bacterium]